MASNQQVFMFLVLGWILCGVIGWQACEFFREKTIKCPWDKCRHNEDGRCSKNGIVELKLLVIDDHCEGLVCDSCNPQKEVKRCINMRI